MGESHVFLMLGTLTPDSKSLGQASTFPSSLPAYVLDLCFLFVLGCFLLYKELHQPSQRGHLLSNLKAASICLSISPCKLNQRPESTLSRFVDDTERHVSSLLTGRFRIKLFDEYSLNSNYVLTLGYRNHYSFLKYVSIRLKLKG